MISNRTINNMKFSIALCILLSFSPAIYGSFSSCINDDIHKKEDYCANVSGASDSNIEAARKDKSIPDDKSMIAFAKCMLQQYNVINADGSVNQNTQSYTIPRDVIYSGMFESCRDQTGENADDQTRKMFNCFLNSNHFIMAFTPRGTKTPNC